MEEWAPEELFRVIKNGVRMTGMPAWGPTHSDAKIWAIVAFLEKRPHMSAEQYRQMGRTAGPEEDDEHHHAADEVGHDHDTGDATGRHHDADVHDPDGGAAPERVNTSLMYSARMEATLRWRVSFQGGQVQSALDEFRPHCELTVRNRVDGPQTVYSDRFLVTRVLADTVQVATAGNVIITVNVDIQLSSGGGGGGDGEGRQIKTFIFLLHSDRQPDVLSLVCGGAFDLPARAARPSLQQIEHALGDYATLLVQ